jgi:hypothetical protein
MIVTVVKKRLWLLKLRACVSAAAGSGLTRQALLEMVLVALQDCFELALVCWIGDGVCLSGVCVCFLGVNICCLGLCFLEWRWCLLHARVAWGLCFLEWRWCLLHTR